MRKFFLAIFVTLSYKMSGNKNGEITHICAAYG
jgi:hypothetical protein